MNRSTPFPKLLNPEEFPESDNVVTTGDGYREHDNDDDNNNNNKRL